MTEDFETKIPVKIFEKAYYTKVYETGMLVWGKLEACNRCKFCTVRALSIEKCQRGYVSW